MNRFAATIAKNLRSNAFYITTLVTELGYGMLTTLRTIYGGISRRALSKTRMTSWSWNSSSEPGQPFKILIENFNKNPVKFNDQQIVVSIDDHPDIIAEANVTHA